MSTPTAAADGRVSERRSAPTEIRAKGRRLEGLAALYNVEAIIGGKSGFTETIQPGAFRRSLRGADVVAMVDHDPGRVLARTRSGTLRLGEDTRGLVFDLDVPPTSYGTDILALVERGDVGGMSFGFSVAERGDRWQGKRRELLDLDLHEVSVVASWPAYQGTVVQARSLIGKPPARIVFARLFLGTVS